MHEDDSTTITTESEINKNDPKTLAEWQDRYSTVPYHEADWELLKTLAIKENKSFRCIAKEFQIARNTIRKYVNGEGKLNRRPQPVRDQWRDTVKQIWAYHSANSGTSQITAQWIFTLLVEKHGYQGSERTIRTLILELKENQNGEDSNQ